MDVKKCRRKYIFDTIKNIFTGLLGEYVLNMFSENNLKSHLHSNF
jgi:hypothetical protein